jgi:hypothetical protein
VQSDFPKALYVKYVWIKRKCPILIDSLLIVPNTHGHYLGDQTKKNEMGGPHNRYGGAALRVLVGKPEGRRLLGRPRRRREDNIKMDFQDVGWGHGLD